MTAVTALLRQPHSDWLARIRTVGLGLGKRRLIQTLRLGPANERLSQVIQSLV